MPDYSLPRWGKPKPKDLRKSADDLRERAAKLDRIADRMEEDQIKSLLFDGGKMFEAGIEKVDHYIQNARASAAKLED